MPSKKPIKRGRKVTIASPKAKAKRSRQAKAKDASKAGRNPRKGRDIPSDTATASIVAHVMQILKSSDSNLEKVKSEMIKEEHKRRGRRGLKVGEKSAWTKGATRGRGGRKHKKIKGSKPSRRMN